VPIVRQGTDPPGRRAPVEVGQVKGRDRTTSGKRSLTDRTSTEKPANCDPRSKGSEKVGRRRSKQIGYRKIERRTGQKEKKHKELKTTPGLQGEISVREKKK